MFVALRLIASFVFVFSACSYVVFHAKQQTTTFTHNNQQANQVYASRIFLTLGENSNWKFHFDDIDKILTKTHTDTQGHLALDSSILRILQLAYSKLPRDLDKKNLNRLSFLINKSYPTNQGIQLANLLLVFYKYQHAKDQCQRNARASSNTSRIDDYLALISLREQHFGKKTAQKIFSHQYRLMKNLSSIPASKEAP